MYLVLTGHHPEIVNVINIARQAADALPADSITLIQKLIEEFKLRSSVDIDRADQALGDSRRAKKDRDTYAALDTFVAENMRGLRPPVSEDLRSTAHGLAKRYKEIEDDLAEEFARAERQPCWICKELSGTERSWWRIGSASDPGAKLSWVHAGACDDLLLDRVRNGRVAGAWRGSDGNPFKKR